MVVSTANILPRGRTKNERNELATTTAHRGVVRLATAVESGAWWTCSVQHNSKKRRISRRDHNSTTPSTTTASSTWGHHLHPKSKSLNLSTSAAEIARFRDEMATNPFASSPLSSSAGYERDELEELRRHHHSGSPTTAADDHEYQRVTSHHSVISLQHHNQAITSSPTTSTSIPSFPTQIPNLQIDRDDAGLLLPSSASSLNADLDLDLMAEKMMHLPPSSAEAGHGRLARWCPPLRPLGRLLRWLNPRIRHTNPSGGSLAGYWYISAEQHALEFLLFNLTFAGLLVYFGINLVAHGTPSAFFKKIYLIYI